MAFRIDMLKGILERQPEDEFAQYALGLEHLKIEEYEEAQALFERLVEQAPDYLATYYQYGTLLQKLGRNEEAAEILRRRVTVAEKAGEGHTKTELLEALSVLE